MTVPTRANPAVASRQPATLATLLGLTRWREHVASTLAATLLGVNMAAWAHPQIPLPVPEIAAVLAANVLAVAFAFMLNDLEDAPDDARDPARGAQNVVAGGQLSPRTGWIASAAVGLAALALFALAGLRPLAVGSLTLALALLYSWRAVRLKAWPLVDVLAHALMLSALLFLAGSLTLHRALGRAWWAFLGVAFISAYGQLYNQLRDWDADRAAGLRNTASILGRKGTQRALSTCLAAGALCLGATVTLRLWPGWLALVPLVGAPIVLALPRRTDLRGSVPSDPTARLQSGALWIALTTMLVWLAACLVR